MPRRTKNAAVAALETQIESHVAGRIRLRRGLLGMSQSDLARSLGITFQQVQKYERGSNRVSIGKLYRLADILDVPLTFFFDGLDVPEVGRSLQGASGADDVPSPMLSRRELDLLRAWRQSPEDVADAVSSLLRAVAPHGAGAEPDTAPMTEPERTAKPAGAKAGSAGAAAAASRSTRKVDSDSEATRRRRRGAVWDPADITRASGGNRSRT